MHQFFKFPEIITIIAEEGLKDEDCLVRKGILCLARTCQVLYEPIANVIWRSLPDIMPLVKCIPQDVLAKAKGDHTGSSGFRPILSQDLSRMRLNAARVRVYGVEVDMDEIRDAAPDEDIRYTFRLLSLLNGGSTLLPNLREANINGSAVDLLPFAHCFTSPELKILKIAVPLDAMTQHSVFECLSFLCSIGFRFPLLETFSLNIAGNELPTTPLAIADIFTSARWQHLSSLSIYGSEIPYRTLLPLLDSNSLRKIDVRITETAEIPHECSKKPSSPIFPHAEEFCLEFAQLSQGIDFLHHLKPRTTPVRSISIRAIDSTRSTTAMWKNVCESIRRTFEVPEALHNLTLEDEDDSDVPVSYYLSLDEINPLRDFTFLRNVRIASQASLHLDDTDIRQIAMSWPKLRSLTLVGGGFHRPKATLKVLATFAELCPHLEDLGIEVDALVSQTSFSGQSTPPRGQNLKMFDVYMSPIASPEVVAAFISDIFPHIETVGCNWSIDKESDFFNKDAAEAWKQVDDLVEVFAKVRLESESRIITGHGFEARVE